MPTEIASSGVFVNVPKPDTSALFESHLLNQISLYERKLDQARAALAAFRDLKDGALVDSGSARSKSTTVKKGEYQGQKVMIALEHYLKQRRGTKVTLQQASEDLALGGADPGAARGSKTDPAKLIAHKIKIGLVQKTRIFDWDPKYTKSNGRCVVLANFRDDEVKLWLADTADIPYASPSRKKLNLRKRRA